LNLSVRMGIIGNIIGLVMTLKSRETRMLGIAGVGTEVLIAYFEAAIFLTYCSNIPFYL
jgi:hypothetical protein